MGCACSASEDAGPAGDPTIGLDEFCFSVAPSNETLHHPLSRTFTAAPLHNASGELVSSRVTLAPKHRNVDTAAVITSPDGRPLATGSPVDALRASTTAAPGANRAQQLDHSIVDIVLSAAPRSPGGASSASVDGRKPAQDVSHSGSLVAIDTVAAKSDSRTSAGCSERGSLARRPPSTAKSPAPRSGSRGGDTVASFPVLFGDSQFGDDEEREISLGFDGMFSTPGVAAAAGAPPAGADATTVFVLQPAESSTTAAGPGLPVSRTGILPSALPPRRPSGPSARLTAPSLRRSRLTEGLLALHDAQAPECTDCLFVV